MRWQKRPQHDGGLKLTHKGAVHTKDAGSLGGMSVKHDCIEQLGLSMVEDLRVN